MSDYKCSKCDLLAYSKNVRTRSIFTEVKMSSMYSNLVKIKTEKKENGLRQVILTLPFMESGKETKPQSDEVLELQAFKMIQEIPPDILMYLVCDHDWKLIPNTGYEL